MQCDKLGDNSVVASTIHGVTGFGGHATCTCVFQRLIIYCRKPRPRSLRGSVVLAELAALVVLVVLQVSPGGSWDPAGPQRSSTSSASSASSVGSASSTLRTPVRTVDPYRTPEYVEQVEQFLRRLSR